MKNVSIQGIIPPILTPMNADESINEQELRSQVNREIEAGVHGIFAFGTNGEAYALSAAEKDRVLEVVIEETNHRVPVYAGTGCITTKETIEMSKKAAAMGADVLSIITPYFAAASQDELYAHYMAVAEAVDLPIVLYNIPARTGNALSPATVAKLAKNAPNIVGAKDSSGNFDNLKQYIEQTRGLDKEFSVLSGNDSLILPALVFGGKGGIAGCANVFPAPWWRSMRPIWPETWRGPCGCRTASGLSEPCSSTATPTRSSRLPPGSWAIRGQLPQAVLPAFRPGNGGAEEGAGALQGQRPALRPRP